MPATATRPTGFFIGLLCHLCGTPFTSRLYDVLSRKTQSCGCYRRSQTKVVGKSNKKHGHIINNIESKTHKSWHSMWTRCTNQKSVGWKYYGNRGIKVCKRWDEFTNFLLDMGIRPENRTLDRIDVNGNYEPSNCRWATLRQQQKNKRR